MQSNLAWTKTYDPFIGPFNAHLYACCANSMGLHGGSYVAAYTMLSKHLCMATVFAA